MKIALCQMDIAWQDVPKNLAKVKELLGRARAQMSADQGGVAVLPEMCLTGFSMKPDEAALPPDSPHLREFVAFTRGFPGLVFGGVAVRRPEGPFNECWVMRDGQLLGTYRKVNLFSFAGEHDVYRPGKSVSLVDFDGAVFAPVICYDLRFSELFLKVAGKVTAAYVVIANWPSTRRDQWKALLRARALDTQAYVIGVNRVGSGNGLEYSGDSAIFDPAGRQLSDFQEGEAVIIADVDLDETARFRSRFPVLTDRAKLVEALEGGLKTEYIGVHGKVE